MVVPGVEVVLHQQEPVGLVIRPQLLRLKEMAVEPASRVALLVRLVAEVVGHLR
jgi:hypothetical protein